MGHQADSEHTASHVHKQAVASRAMASEHAVQTPWPVQGDWCLPPVTPMQIMDAQSMAAQWGAAAHDDALALSRLGDEVAQAVVVLLRAYYAQLCDLGLVILPVQHLVQELLQWPEVLAAKGCGAAVQIPC